LLLARSALDSPSHRPNLENPQLPPFISPPQLQSTKSNVSLPPTPPHHFPSGSTVHCFIISKIALKSQQKIEQMNNFFFSESGKNYRWKKERFEYRKKTQKFTHNEFRIR
jgi:hypothetical protein